MATSFTVAASVAFPPSTGQPVATRPASSSGTFTQKHDDTYVLSGSSTKTLTFDADVKVLLVQVVSATAPVNVQFNGGSDSVELSAGGFIGYSNPSPGTGITSLAIVHTTDAEVHVIGLS